MSLNAFVIGNERGWLYRTATPPEDSTRLGLLQIPIADFGDRDSGFAGGVLVTDWIAPAGSCTEELLRLDPRLVDRERTVTADRRLPEDTDSTATSAISGDEGLSARGFNPDAEPRQLCIPRDGASGTWLKRVDDALGQLCPAQFVQFRLGHHLVITEFGSPVEPQATQYRRNLRKISPESKRGEAQTTTEKIGSSIRNAEVRGSIPLGSTRMPAIPQGSRIPVRSTH